MRRGSIPSAVTRLASTLLGALAITACDEDPGVAADAGVDAAMDAAIDAPPATDGGPACTKNVVVMGFWPPTNEMLRPWSTSAEQNPEGWIGRDWEGLGYDVHAFFPEFPPDGDPTNDAIGDEGSVGSPLFDLQVDYQETSADFWRIVDEHQPVILLTTSRGSSGWEIEALEGGHGVGNPMGPSRDWISDGYGDVAFPTEASIDARSWEAISTYRQGNTLPSQLPMDAIVEATAALGIASVFIDAEGTSGNYLSGFLGLHGLYYQSTTPFNVAAGHIHVGGDVAVSDARTLVQTTLRSILAQHPASTTACPPRR